MSEQAKHIYEFGAFRLDPAEHVLLRHGQLVPLAPKIFETLLALVENAGHVVDKDQLIKKVWPDTFVEEVSLAKNVWVLRNTLGGEQSEQYIETIPKRGYRFVAEVREARPEFDADSIPAQADQTPLAVAPSAPRRIGRWAQLIIFIALVVVVSAVVWLIAFRRPVPLPLLKITPFTSFPGNEAQPSFSPDGNSLAFSWDGGQGSNEDIYVRQVGTESQIRLTTDAAADSWPSWSADGRHIAFMRRTAEGFGLYLIPALGGIERKIAELPLTTFLVVQSPPSWSPDGEWLAVTDRLSAQEPFSVFLVSRETGEKRKLTSPPGISNNDAGPAISPDGRSVAFFRYNSGMVGDLYLVPMAGGEARRLTFDQASIAAAAWTPDGRDILFLSRRGGGAGFSLWRVSATGGAPEQVEAVGRNLSVIAISRQGNRLAWVQKTDDRNIWRMELTDAASPAGRKPSPASAKLFISSTRNDVQPQYSPNGERIAYVSDRSGNWEIWVCDSDGQQHVPLTAFNRSITNGPRWSPDGRQIAFHSSAAGSADIYVISADGGKPRRLTTEDTQDTVPTWSPDSQWIYFRSNRSGSHQIWKMPALGGKAVQVTKGGSLDHIESHDSRFLYFSKGDVPGIWRTPVAGGEETPVLEHHPAGIFRRWVVTRQGIWLITPRTPDNWGIEFFSFATEKLTTVASLEKMATEIASFDISPDGRWLIWTQQDHPGSDIMLMENFR